MFGNNPIRKPAKSDGQVLAVKSVFPTLQGEGPFVGVPSVFIRLGGCNLTCNFCDTDFEDFSDVELVDLLAQVYELSAGIRKLVVITGGEPLRQNIVPLCAALIAAGYKVQIETNGTLYQELPKAVHIICSPKITSGRYHEIRPDLLARIHAFKFIVAKDHPEYEAVAEVGQTQYGQEVYVQPMDEQDEARNKVNTEHALALCLEHGYRLSLQTHKMLGIE